MSNHPLRTVVATTLHVIHADGGYIAPTKNATTNTITKVLATLKANPLPDVEPEFWQFANEMIEFFRILDTLPDYKKICASDDGAMYQTCVKTVKADEVTPLTFPYVVAMPTLYAKLKPAKPKSLNPLKSEAKITKPDEYMGTLNVEDRFFVKLIKVGEHDATKGGTIFHVTDRNGNNGIFYELPTRLEGKIWLGDCFAMHATPTRFQLEPNGEKRTVFRTIKVLLDTVISGKQKVNRTNDSTNGKFTKNIPIDAGKRTDDDDELPITYDVQLTKLKIVRQ
jgi:hypothetical protein